MKSLWVEKVRRGNQQIKKETSLRIELLNVSVILLAIGKMFRRSLAFLSGDAESKPSGFWPFGQNIKNERNRIRKNWNTTNDDKPFTATILIFVSLRLEMRCLYIVCFLCYISTLYCPTWLRIMIWCA
jgi:hypothetical protein